MKLWLDADREPDVDWVWARTAHCAIVLLRGGCVDRISLAPDQRAMVNEVLDWMIAYRSDAHPSTHPATAGARHSPGLLKISYPSWAAAL